MKQYNGEKAIISLTSWKARINTVGLTLFSLYKKCPGFHIVLVLSEEEFPKKEAELPDSIMAFVDQDLIEILWVYKNYKSFKKVLFTMQKYKHIPIISADDDCIYTCNYAKELYNVWINNKEKCISAGVAKQDGFTYTCGASTLYAPNCFKNMGIDNIELVFKFGGNDDAFIGALYKKLNIGCISINKRHFVFHDDVKAMSVLEKYNAKRDLYNFYNSIRG